jgi:RecA-family ATPase
MISACDLARALGGEVCSNKVEVLAPGPGHSPSDRSLKVKIGADLPEGYLTHSFAGDDPIVCRDHVREKSGLPSWEPEHKQEIKSNVSSEWIYRDADGEPYLRVQRYPRADGSKSYPQAHWENGRWVSKKPTGPKIPYRLPQLIKADPAAPVFICEGEKCADAVAMHGLVATSASEGAEKWTPDLNKWFEGRTVFVLPDNDAPGQRHAELVARNVHGVAADVRIVPLPALAAGEDVYDWLHRGNTPETLAMLCDEAPKWKPAGAPEIDPTSDAPAPPLPYLDMSSWDANPAPDREWAVENRIPMYQPHLTTGHGAIGKSLLELMRAVAHVLGKPWLGMQVRQGPVIYLGAEDDEPELQRRLEAILRYYSATFADVAGHLHLLFYVGEDCLLGVPDSKGIIQPTELFHRVLADAVRIKPVSLFFDTLTDVYAGDEINRNQTTQFVKLLQHMAIKARCSVSILAHPSNAGMATGSGISGSTGWHNKVRSRLYMLAPTTAKGEEIDSDLRELKFMKNNYGRQGDAIQIRWDNGVFVVEGGATGFERVAADQRADERFMQLLGRYAQQGRNVSDKAKANNYAPAAFADERDGDNKRLSIAAFKLAMQRLFTAGKIHVEEYGPPSKGWARLAIKARL